MRKVKTINNKQSINVGKNTLLFQPDRNLQDDLFNIYNEILQTGSTTNQTYLAKVLAADFKGLDKKQSTLNPLSVAKEMNNIVKATTDYMDSKKSQDKDYIQYLLYKDALPWQKPVLSTCSKKVQLLAGRRSGKTYVLSLKAIQHCLEGADLINVGGKTVSKVKNVLIYGITITRAHQLYWQQILDLIEKCHIKTHSIDNSTFNITFSNGSFIQLAGCSSKAEIEKYRGADASCVIIDECQSIKNLYTLVDNILMPMLTARNGQLFLAGTGPLTASGMWNQITNENDYERFTATMKDNITIPNAAEALEQVLIDNHWDKDNVIFRREYLGELVYDSEILVFPNRYYYSDLPKANWKKAYIGVDYGFTDASAVALVLIDDNDNLYLVDEWKQRKSNVSEIINNILKMHNYCQETFGIQVSKTVCDTNEQLITKEMYKRGVVNATNAYKVDKNRQINFLNELLATEKLRIKKDNPFDKECNIIQWKKNADNNKIVFEIDDNIYHPDMMDAVRYCVYQMKMDLL